MYVTNNRGWRLYKENSTAEKFFPHASLFPLVTRKKKYASLSSSETFQNDG